MGFVIDRYRLLLDQMQLPAGTSTRLGLTGGERIISYRKLRLAGEPAPYM